MPLLKIHSNIEPDAEQQDDFLAKASQTVAAMLGKSERYVMVLMQPMAKGVFAGDSLSPLAYLELKSIDLPEQQTGEFSQILCDLISHDLGISSDRIYIEFSNAERHLWGWNSTTF